MNDDGLQLPTYSFEVEVQIQFLTSPHITSPHPPNSQLLKKKEKDCLKTPN